MAGPTPDAIESFVGITGASHSLAVRKLEEHGGNLDEALNAHFSGIESCNTNAVPSTLPLYSPVNPINQVPNEPRGISPVISAVRSFRPSLLLDPSYRRNLWNQLGASVFNSGRPSTAPTIPYASGYEPPPYQSGARPAMQDAYGASLSNHVHPYGTMSRYDEPHPSDNNVEEEMLRRAIEASKQDIQTSSRAGVVQGELHLEDEELARAVSFSMKTAEEEKAMRELVAKDQVRAHDLSERAGSSHSWQDGSSSSREKVVDEQLWSAMSSEELDEAILLETAIFGQNYRGSSHKQASVVPTSEDRSSVSVSSKSAQNPLSDLRKERQSLREEQDNEYLASLLADKEKEVAVSKKAEVSSPIEEGSSQSTMLDDVGKERLLAAKEALLPEEPLVDEENAVTLLLRMPDGSRHGRRFLKSDKLKCVFDFIDVGRAVKPGTYRVVRPYPRRAFSVEDGSLSLYEAGLNSKQEALFLEFI